MEQLRLLLAVVLSLIVFVLWDLFFVPKQPIQKNNKTVAEQSATESDHTDTEKKDASITPVQMPQTPVAVQAPSTAPARVITVNTPFYSAQITEQGAVIRSFKLTQYRETPAKDSPPKEVVTDGDISDNGRIRLINNSVPGLQHAVFTASIDDTQLDIMSGTGSIVFSWQSENGIGIDKIFRFDANSYLVGLDVVVKNMSQGPLQDQMALMLSKPIDKNEKKPAYGFEGPSALINGGLEQIKLDDIEDKNQYKGKITWVALEDRYFLRSIIPQKTDEATLKLTLASDKLVSSHVSPSWVISPGMQKQFTANLFIGPKSLSLLKTFNNGLDRIIYFGWFDFIAKPCLWLLNFLHRFIPNYGVAIIILTILIKIILWPLGNKSYKSMNEMKKLQPLMAEIREKYKHDKKKMNEELMQLYKTYKINPMGGCLPMFLQIPVFFALYRMLYEAIELRHAPFFGWINDLSAPDRLGNFSFSIPLMEPPYGIPVLTLIMGATMFIQQKMSPPPGDPTQAKLMMAMPIVFTVIFINFSSGLVLYWLVNNILSILQQYYIARKS